MRTFLSIATLLVAASAGAENARAAFEFRNPETGTSSVCQCVYSTIGAGFMECDDCTPEPPSRNASRRMAFEVRSPETGTSSVCPCIYRTTGAGFMVCDACTATPSDPQPAFRITLRHHNAPGEQRSAEAWREVFERSGDDARARALLAEFEVIIDGWRYEFAFRCRSNPTDRRYRSSGGLTMPQRRDTLIRQVRAVAERECSEAEGQVATRDPETMWAGGPAQDAYDRAGYNRLANPKIRLTAIPEGVSRQRDDESTSWERLRYALISDELIYACTKELLIDPVSVDDADIDRPKFRLKMRFICANDPSRLVDFYAPNGLGVSDIRTWLRQRITSACRLGIYKAPTTARRGTSL